MLRKALGVILLTLLLTGFFSVIRSEDQSVINLQSVTMTSTKPNSSNAMKLPIVMIQLENGSYVNCSSVDEALIQIYSGAISVNEIKNISVSLFKDYYAYLSNKTSTVKYTSALKIFYQRLSPELSKKYANYSGQIVPVSDKEYLGLTYGIHYPRIALYGKVSQFNVTAVDIPTNSTVSKNILEFDSKVFLLIYLKMETYETADIVLDYARNIAKRFDKNVYILIIDTTNGFDVSQYLSNKTLPENILIVWNNQTTVSAGKTGSIEAFTINATDAEPLIILMDNQGLVWFKTYGIVTLDEIVTYMSMYIEKNVSSLPVYPILAVIAKDPYAGKPCKIYIIVGTGFGNITEAKLSYALLDSENKTIYRTSRPISVSPTTLLYTIESLDNRTRWITVNATISSTYGSYSSGIFVYKVMYEEEKLPSPIELVAPIIYALVSLIVILGVAFRIYRKYFKVGK